MKKITKDSSINVKTNNSQIDGDLIIGGHNSKIVKKTVIHDNSIRYDVDKENNLFYDLISPYLIEKLGIKKVLGLGLITLVTGGLSIFGSTGSTSNNTLFWIGAILLFFCIVFFGVLIHYSNTKCQNCNREFAYEELGTPQVREVQTADGYIKQTTTRQYKCKYCGDVQTRKVNKTIDPNSDFK